MKTGHIKAPLLAAICLLVGVQVHAEKLNDILNQISSDLESRKATNAATLPPAQQPSKPAADGRAVRDDGIAKQIRDAAEGGDPGIQFVTEKSPGRICAGS